jgi:fructan beta-fructosidase
LLTSGDGYQVASRPVAELQALRKSTIEITEKSIALEEELVELELTPTIGSDFVIELSNEKGEKVFFKKSGDSLVFDRTASGLVDFEARFAKVHSAPLNGLEVKSIKIYIDRSSVEIFVNDGEMVMTELVFPTESYSKLKLTGIEQSGSIHYLKSIW